MNLEEFEKRAETIVDDELNNIKMMLKKIPDPNAKDEADRLGLSTIDVDIKNNQLAYMFAKITALVFLSLLLLSSCSTQQAPKKFKLSKSCCVNGPTGFCNASRMAAFRPGSGMETSCARVGAA